MPDKNKQLQTDDLATKLKVELLNFLSHQIDDTTNLETFRDAVKQEISDRMTLDASDPQSITSASLVKLFEIILNYESQKSMGVLNILKEHINSSLLANFAKSLGDKDLDDSTITKDVIARFKNVANLIEMLAESDAQKKSEKEI